MPKSANYSYLFKNFPKKQQINTEPALFADFFHRQFFVSILLWMDLGHNLLNTRHIWYQMKAEKLENVFGLWSNSRKYDPFEIQAKTKKLKGCPQTFFRYCISTLFSKQKFR